MNVRYFQFYDPYIRINKLKAPIMIKIMKVENNNTEKSFNHEENNYKKDMKR